ncbi:hypothetical protein Tco_0210122 [Tanacetum coccineum]
MNKKSYSFDMETFRSMLQMCLRLPRQQFVDPPFEEHILIFMRDLSYPGNIKLLSDVKVDTLPQPWRTFGIIINKCLSGKVTGIDTLRLSKAHILWGLYHQQTVDYVYLLWEDLVYQIENKETRKNKYMFYPRFTKVIINHFMSQDKSISRKNKVDWHMANDDPILTTKIFISQHEVVQRYGAILPDYLTNPTMKASEAYKTYHDLATGKSQNNSKVAKSRKKKQSASGLETLSDIALTEAQQLKLATQQSLIQTHNLHASGSGAHEGTGVIPGVHDVPTYGSDDENISWKSSDEDDDDDNDEADDANYVQSDDDVNKGQDVQEDDDDESTESDNDDDEDNDAETQDVNIQGEKMDEKVTNEEEVGNELYMDLKVNLAVNPEGQQQSSLVSSGFVTNMLNPNPDSGIDSLFNIHTEVTSLVDDPVTTIAEPSFLATTILPPPPNPLITQMQQAPAPTPAIVPSSSLYDLPNFGSLFGFDHRLKALEDNFLEFIQMNQFATVVTSIPGIVDHYLDNRMNDALVNNQLEFEFLIRSLKEANTSHAVAANLSKLELKKILIDKMEANKSIDILDIQKNLYKALVDAYEADKNILDTYGDTVTFKRRRDDVDDDEEPSAGSDRGFKRRRYRKEPESTSSLKEKTFKSTGSSKEGLKSKTRSTDKSAHLEEPVYTVDVLEQPAHQEFNTGFTKDQPAKETTQFPDWFQRPTKLPSPDHPRESFNELMDTPLDFSAFVMNRLKVDTLTLELLAGPTFELMKGSCKSLTELEYFLEEVYKATTEQLDWTNLEGQQYPHDLIIAVTKLEIVEWQNYKHFDLITVRRDDDKLYTFKEGNFNRLRIQDIKDMLLLLVKGKLTNLTVEERLAFNVSLRMLTRSIVIQRRMEDLQLGVESYQKKLNLTKLDTDGTLDDVRTALNDHLKGIQMQYLPQTIWRKRDKDNAGAMVQEIDKQLKTRRIMRILEKFVGGRPYEGDFRLMQRTI